MSTGEVKFIQNQWQAFVVIENSLLDFKEPLFNKSLGYLFAFEYILPIQVSPEKYTAFPKPLKISVYVAEHRLNDNEMEGLIEYLKQQLEINEDIADQWFKIIQVLANAKLKYLLSSIEVLKEVYQKIENAFNIRFQRFINNNYGSLFFTQWSKKASCNFSNN